MSPATLNCDSFNSAPINSTVADSHETDETITKQTTEIRSYEAIEDVAAAAASMRHGIYIVIIKSSSSSAVVANWLSS